MRSSIYQRRARADHLRVSIRDDVIQDPAEDSASDSEDDGGLDSPSPTSPNFPDGTPATTSTPIPPSSTQITSTATSTDTLRGSTQLTSTSILPESTQLESTPISSSTTQRTSTATSLPAIQTDSTTVDASQNESSQAQVSDGGTDMPGMSKDGAIAFGAVGGAVIVAALIFIVWKFGLRRRNRGTGSGNSLFSKFGPSGFRKMEEDPRQRGTMDYGPPGRAQTNTMDHLMAAAYAAEDGNASQYGVYAEEKRQPNISEPVVAMRGSNTFGPRASANSSGQTNSLYVNQLMSGYYKGAGADGLSVPANARMPPPAAPSVAGQTEVTNTTESTWRTWGWSQQKKPKETWVDKCIRRGGLK